MNQFSSFTVSVSLRFKYNSWHNKMFEFFEKFLYFIKRKLREMLKIIVKKKI